MNKINKDIINWHKEKHPHADEWDVYRKLCEEVGELAEAMRRGNYENIDLEAGDVAICLLILIERYHLTTLSECIAKSHTKNINKKVTK